jgi:hypothetical protein
METKSLRGFAIQAAGMAALVLLLGGPIFADMGPFTFTAKT